MKICYNAFNAPVGVTDADGVVTEYTYSDFGLVERVARKDGDLFGKSILRAGNSAASNDGSGYVFTLAIVISLSLNEEVLQ